MASCCICGESTDDLQPLPVSENFTAYQFLQAGDGVCTKCAKFFDDKYRRSSWVMADGKTRLLSRDNALGALLNPPSKPFIIYLTRTKKKQGWLRVIYRPNYSRENFIVAWDDDVVFVQREKLKHFVNLINRLRTHTSITKTELENGVCSAATIKSIKSAGLMNVYAETKKYAGDMLWRLAVWLTK